MDVSQRGQAAAGAAVLVFIIAGLIIGFIILIPPQERAELLGEQATPSTTPTSPTQASTEIITEKNLLTVSPGRLDFLSEEEVEHPLPAVNIHTKIEAAILAEKNVFSAKNSVFTDKIDTLTFTITDLKNTKNILLSFALTESVGPLSIMLNGEEVFYGEANVGALPPIHIPQGLLKEENVFIFSAGSPGLAFWATHRHTAKNIKVVADVRNIEAQVSKSIFLVSEPEYENLERVTLRFRPSCTPNTVGPLRITLNNHEVYNGIPECDLATIPVEVSPTILVKGENKLVFFTEEGTYFLSHITINSELEAIDFPTYYFELSSEEHNSVVQGDLRVRLQMDFVDIVAIKKGELVFNAHLRQFDTKEVTFTSDLSELIVLGNNALKIKPKKTIEIRELRVDLVK